MAGAGYKLFNTGDVLTAAQVNTYLMEQTVMVFADAAARTTALSGVLSEGMLSYLKDTNKVEVYDGSAWVDFTGDITGVTAGTGLSGGGTSGTVTLTNTVATAFDAKGDLIGGTGADTFAKLTVGANNTILMADSTQSTGLAWAGDWISYTPTWTADTTNPAIGNGSLTGGYRRIGSKVDFWIRVLAGSTTTYGSGNYRLGLPVNLVNSEYNEGYVVGLLDAGVAWYNNNYGSGVASGFVDKFYIYNQSFSTIWGPTTPFTFGNTDAVFVQGSYKVA